MSATETPCLDLFPDPDRRAVILAAFNALDLDLCHLRGHLHALMIAAEDTDLCKDSPVSSMFWAAHAAAMDVVMRCETRTSTLYLEVAR